MDTTKNWRGAADEVWATSERRARLEYMADLLRELESLAERDGCLKLPNVLALARAEAFREALKDEI